KSKQTENATDDDRLVVFEPCESQALKTDQRQPGEGYHSSDRRNREDATQQSKTEPTVLGSGQKHRQKCFTRRKGQECEQSQDRGPIGSSSRPIFFNGAFFLFNGLVVMMMIMTMEMRVVMVMLLMRMPSEQMDVVVSAVELPNEVEHAHCD